MSALLFYFYLLFQISILGMNNRTGQEMLNGCILKSGSHEERIVGFSEILPRRGE